MKPGACYAPIVRLGVCAVALWTSACSTPPQGAGGAGQRPADPAVPAAASRLAADTPSTTVAGNSFVAPAGWLLSVRGPATVLEAPEGGSFIALIDLAATDADAAVAAAWAAYKPAANAANAANWPLTVVTPVAPRDGWTDRKSYSYQTSPNEHRDVSVGVRRAGGLWTVTIYDMASEVGGKRGAQVNLIFGKLLPKGYRRESFAGRTAHPLNAERIDALQRFVATASRLTGVPGVSFGLVQHGRVVYSGGHGVREMGKPQPVDGDTRYMVASNTKAMVTLMLARLVDDGKIAWDTPAASLLPSFKLGNAETTAQVQIKHLICACTGMPRQDLEWLLEFKESTPASALRTLGTMQPTSGFGELYQYSNPMAAAAGYVGGHVLFPQMELGAAYDRAMQSLVFGPLGMAATTHDFDIARSGNAAVPHAPDIDGRMTLAEARVNLSIVPVRPAGGAWSTVNDMLKYVAMELAQGSLPDGSRYVGRDALLARRAPQVAVGTDVSYGMGLIVDNEYGTPMVRHGGSLTGFYSDMMWLPEHGVGAVILTNGAPGWLIHGAFRRKLLEVLFDGLPGADATLAAQAKAYVEQIAARRKLLQVPPDPAATADLAARYMHPALGEVAVRTEDGALRIDFGEFSSGLASRRNPDGTHSIVTTVPGFSGLDFLVGQADGKRALILRDAQHKYVLLER